MFSYLGYPLLWFGLDPYRSDDIVNQFIILQMFFYSSVSITFLLLGFLLAKIVIGSLPLKTVLKNCFDKEEFEPKALMSINCVLFVICCLAVYFYINSVGADRLGLFVALDLVSSSMDVTSLRSDASNGLANYHWYRLFTADLLLFCTFCFFALYKYHNSKIRSVFCSLAIFICAISLTMSGEKALIIELLLGLFLISSIKNRGGKLPVKQLGKFSILVLIIIVPIYYLLMDASGILEALQQVGSRILTGQLHPSYVYLEYFPRYRDFLFGTSFPNPGSIFPYEAVTITQEVMAWNNPEEAARGVIGSMPAMFWVEAYINFGALSVPFISIFLGFFLYVVNYLILRLSFNSLVLSFYVWLILFYKDLSISFFSDFIINIYFIGTLGFFCIFYLICYRGKVYLISSGTQKIFLHDTYNKGFKRHGLIAEKS